MKTGHRNIENGNGYNYLFPRPIGKNILVKRSANLDDTVEMMRSVVHTTLGDTRALAILLKADTIEKTLRNIWNFSFSNLQYRKDAQGIEQVRRPSRVWQDRTLGVDCDCMSVFIGSILTNLKIPFSIRLTKYNSSEFEHVYPIVHTPNKTIIMDCVVHQFDYEVPYTTKKDVVMNLEYLNGFEDEFNEDDDPWTVGQIDEEDDDEDLEGLDGKEERQAKRAAKKESGKPTLRDRLKKGLHIVNRLNPAAALLRAGVLASMKVNLMNAAAKLRFSYWTEAEAAKNDMEPGKFSQLKSIREKLEKIFYGAGGKPENMKKAILTSRGNRDKRVALNGLGEIISYVDLDDDLEQILGFETYADEFSDVENEDGINGLGSITAGAAIASATGVIGTIAALIKKLGVLFKKGSPQAQQEILADNTSVENSQISPEQMDKVGKYLEAAENSTATASAKRSETTDLIVPKTDDGSGASKNAIVKSGEESSEGDETEKSDKGKPEEKKGGVMEWIGNNKVAAAAIGVAIVGGIFLAYKAYQSSKAKSVNGLDGLSKPSKGKKPQTKKRRTSTKYGDIPTVELL